MDCEEIRLNMLAYLDGEVSDVERAQIEGHLAGCADCAAELERLRALQADLWDTIPLGLEQLRLPGPAEDRIRARLQRAHSRRGLWGALSDLLRPRPTRREPARRSLAFVKAAIPLLVALCFVVAGIIGRRPTPVRALETVVLAPETLAPGTDAALRVIVRETGSTAPISDAEVHVYLRPPGRQQVLLYSGRTGDTGTADVRFDVPEYDQDRVEADLIVTAASSLGESEVRKRVAVERSYHLLLTSDKPLYQPGQTVHLRVLALDAARGLPVVDRPATFSIHDPEGNPLLDRLASTSAYGIAATDYVLGDDAPSGAYRLAVELGDTRSERTVTVGRYERPRFKVAIDALRPYYLAGEIVEAEVIARTFDEAPLPGMDVALRVYLHAPERTLLATMLGRTNKDGVYTFRLSLPTQVPADRANLALEAAVTDKDGHREWAGRVVPLAAEPLAIDAVAEGGRLRPGVENRVYLLAARPDGAPTRARLDVGVAGGRYELQTDEYGLATFSLRPDAGTREVPLQIEATDAEGRRVMRTVTLSADQGPAQVLLRLDRATYEVGQTIRVEVLAGQGEIVYLDVVHRGRGQTLSTHVVTLREGRGTLDLDVSPQMAGTLELHTYQVLDGDPSTGSGLARDARLAVVDAPARVSVDVRADKAAYQPGDLARVDIDTSVGSTPVQSALGIAVVDESVFALEERAPGFAKLFFLLEQRLLDAAAQPPGVALAELLDPTAVEAVHAAQDQAARAAWAKLPAGELALARSSPSEALGMAEARANARLEWLGWCLGVVLIILPLGLWAAVLARLSRSGLWAAAPRRIALKRTTALVIGSTVVILAPLTVVAALGLSLALGQALTQLLLAVLSLAWLAALVVLGIDGWRRREDGTQIALLLAGAYGLLGALLAYVAGRGGDPGPGMAVTVTVAFVAALLALLLLAAGFWAEGRRWTGGLTVILVLLSVALVVLIGAAGAPSSSFVRAIGDPRVFAGPAGWLFGCAPKKVIVEKEAVIRETVIVEKEVIKEVEKVVKETVVVEVEKEVTKVVEVAKEVEKAVPTTFPQATPTAAAAEPAIPTTTPPAPPSPPETPTQAPPSRPSIAATPAPLASPPLLGQFIPETIYWAPEALTDAAGHLEIDLPLPDTPATWRLAILASTLQGELGSAETTLFVKDQEGIGD